MNYTVPTGKIVKGKDETFDIDGYQGRTIVDPKHTRNIPRSPYILDSKAPQFLKDKTLEQERNQFRKTKDIIENPDNPFDRLEVRVNDKAIVPYFESLLEEYDIPGEVKVVPTQVP